MSFAREVSMTLFERLQAWADSQFEEAKVFRITIELRTKDGEPLRVVLDAPTKSDEK